MSNRGWKALDGVGISDSVHVAYPWTNKRAIHLVDKLNFQNYGQEGEYLFNFRGALNKRMIDLANLEPDFLRAKNLMLLF
jgi:kynurenine 3-monooxygenase